MQSVPVQSPPSWRMFSAVWDLSRLGVYCLCGLLTTVLAPALVGMAFFPGSFPESTPTEPCPRKLITNLPVWPRMETDAALLNEFEEPFTIDAAFPLVITYRK